MTEFMNEYERWRNLTDAATKAELDKIKGNTAEIEFRFAQGLNFGTAGLRGIMTAGRNAMNIYTVAQATQGLCCYISETGEGERGVVIGCDSRNNSQLFSRTAAKVFAANGIKVFLFDDLSPTPMISFAIRQLHCISGVNITASHNPKEYNGYKVYWEDGAQISPEAADKISGFISHTDIFSAIKYCDFDEAVLDGKIEIIGPEISELYMSKVLDQRVDPKIVPEMTKDLKIVYTPFHGTGYRIVPEVLRRSGLNQLYTVDAQMIPDGNFPTLASPNPENPEGFELGIKLAEKEGCDLIIATDPDADRIGTMARDSSGKFVTISGNRLGVLLLDYILTAYTENGTMPPEPYAIKTIVTTELTQKICDAFGVKLYNVLTGFKYIGEVIKEHEEAGHGSFIFGYEESYGYLKGTYARDKDSVVASMLVTEMAAYYKKKDMSLCDALDALFEKYGYYSEKTFNFYMSGIGGVEKIKALMQQIRSNPPAEFAGKKIISLRDYLTGEVTDIESGEKCATGLPVSDVLYFGLEGGNSIIARPSGTEPKIKIYMLAHSTGKDESDKLANALGDSFLGMYHQKNEK